MHQLFIIEGRILGQAPRRKEFVHGELQPPVSALFFCRVCGEVYARCPVIQEGVPMPWQSYRRICRKCGKTHKPFLDEVPGAIHLSFDQPFTDAFPVPVLQWELERHLDKLEKENDSEN